MKNSILLAILINLVMVACQSQAMTAPTDIPEIVAPTAEIFITTIPEVPAQVQHNGISLAVEDAIIGECDLPDCPPAPAGTRYLRVTLQALNLPADQFLDYKNLPEGIAIHDNTGVSTPFNRIYAYKPADQQLIIYFAVPEAATAFRLEWPGTSEIPLTVATDQTSAVSPFDHEDNAGVQKTPGHTQIDLGDSHILKDVVHHPQFHVCPDQRYADMVPPGFERIRPLENILSDPNRIFSADQLPTVLYFHAAQVFTSKIQVISFQNGGGVRFPTWYDQYRAGQQHRSVLSFPGRNPGRSLPIHHHNTGYRCSVA